MDADFYSVAIPEPTTILGVRLRPLSLGHLVILHRLKSCFVTPEEKFTPHDLALSVLVCSLSYEDGLRLFSKSRQWIFKVWFWKLTRPSILQKIGIKKPSLIDFPAKAVEFSNYLKRHCEGPHYDYDPSSSVSVHASEIQIVKVSIMQAFGISDKDIMDRSWLLCLWDHVTIKAMAGHLKLTDRSAFTEARNFANELFEKLNTGGRNGVS